MLLVLCVFCSLCAFIGGTIYIYKLIMVVKLTTLAELRSGLFVPRYTEPARPRPFRVPWFWLTTIVSVVLCIYVMLGLPLETWIRFAVWLAIGLALYFGYGYRHSRIRQSSSLPQ